MIYTQKSLVKSTILYVIIVVSKINESKPHHENAVGFLHKRKKSANHLQGARRVEAIQEQPPK